MKLNKIFAVLMIVILVAMALSIPAAAEEPDVAATVENAPLTPNINVAYSLLVFFFTASNAYGNGIPIKNVNGNKSMTDIISLLLKLYCANNTNTLSMKKSLKNNRIGINARDISIIFFEKNLLTKLPIPLNKSNPPNVIINEYVGEPINL